MNFSFFKLIVVYVYLSILRDSIQTVIEDDHTLINT